MGAGLRRFESCRPDLKSLGLREVSAGCRWGKPAFERKRRTLAEVASTPERGLKNEAPACAYSFRSNSRVDRLTGRTPVLQAGYWSSSLHRSTNPRLKISPGCRIALQNRFRYGGRDPVFHGRDRRRGLLGQCSWESRRPPKPPYRVRILAGPQPIEKKVRP